LISLRKYVITVTLVAISGSLLYFFFDPALSDFFPKCIFHSLTGFDCPGCGSQRAIHALLHGEVIKAADMNLLVVLFLPLLFYSAVITVGNLFFHRGWSQPIFNSPFFVKSVLVVVLSFWLLRNLPVSPLRWLSAGT